MLKDEKQNSYNLILVKVIPLIKIVNNKLIITTTNTTR